ncbi:MAG TPA: hypothetical protein VFE55_16050 [Acidimicrobiia bacterium]|nr:hypothetical protein [Acidimicrobiia bacterium]
MFDTPFNVVAGFPTRQLAETAVQRLTSAGVPPASVEVKAGSGADDAVETAELRAEMQDELNHWAPVTGRQARGAAVGTTAFAGAGLVLGGIVGLIVDVVFGLDLAVAGMIAIGALIGVVAGATVGFLAGGGFAPRTGDDARAETFDDPRPRAERDVLLAVHTAEPEMAERAARMLRDDLHADEVHLVDAAGTPLPPQAGSPRPADPEGYWWKAAGEG